MLTKPIPPSFLSRRWDQKHKMSWLAKLDAVLGTLIFRGLVPSGAFVESSILHDTTCLEQLENSGCCCNPEIRLSIRGTADSVPVDYVMTESGQIVSALVN